MAAKFRAPAATERYARRPRLHALMDEVTNAPLTLVVAPAGSGKTTVVSEWLAESSWPAAWLSLDDTDLDAGHFWSNVIAAIQTLAHGTGASAHEVLVRHGEMAEAVEELLDELDTVTRSKAFLVIDDLERIGSDTAVESTLALFLQHLPAWLHVVVLSRWDPALPLDRLRAHGYLGEVRFPELRFAPDEARAMLRRLPVALSDDLLENIIGRSEGWSAGLQLGALAARSDYARRAHDSPRGEEVLIHDYLLHEVLAAEDPEVVEMLLDISVADRVNASLATALTGRPDAVELLRRAEAHSLFVTRLGLDGWYRLHRLFRTALLDEVTRESPQRVAQQHARAARWCEEVHDIPQALQHWIRAGSPGDALHLLAAQQVELYDSARAATIRTVIASIPEVTAAASLESMLEFAWCHLLLSRRRFLELTEQLSWWTSRQGPIDPVFGARLDMLRSIAALMEGRWVDSAVLVRQVLDSIGDGWRSDPYCRLAWNVLARELALSERWQESGDEARAIRFAVGRDPERFLVFQGTEALGEALAGRPIDALRVAAGVRRGVSAGSMPFTRIELALAEALARHEIGDEQRARAQLTELATTPVEAMLYCRVLAILALAEAELDHGNHQAAWEVFGRAEEIVRAETFGPLVHDWLIRTRVRIALSTRDHFDAGDWAARIADPMWRGLELARIHLAGGDGSKALAALAEVEPRCPRHHVLVGLLAARCEGDHARSLAHAVAAVELASSCGMFRTVVAEGPEVLELVERAARSASPEWLDRMRRAAVGSGEHSKAVVPDAVEPLTVRERDVLRFLPSRLTVREISDELYVSVNTLKSHLKVIYRKLGVRSRAEAADVARRMTSL